MAEYGILMQDEMVRAILRPVEDPLHKTVTRRASGQWAKRKVGDLLWVRECWARGAGPRLYRVFYRACDAGEPPEHLESGRWRPGIHMPRGFSRITLRVTDIRQEPCAPSSPGYERAPHPWEPLPWVDDAEARREGVADRAAYLALWRAINGDEYPAWVWRIAFEVARG